MTKRKTDVQIILVFSVFLSFTSLIPISSSAQFNLDLPDAKEGSYTSSEIHTIKPDEWKIELLSVKGADKLSTKRLIGARTDTLKPKIGTFLLLNIRARRLKGPGDFRPSWREVTLVDEKGARFPFGGNFDECDGQYCITFIRGGWLVAKNFGDYNLYFDVPEDHGALALKVSEGLPAIPVIEKQQKPKRRNNDRGIVLELQKKLTELGYNPGPINGIWGTKTRGALKDFQRDSRLLITGKLDQETKKKIGIFAGKTLHEAESLEKDVVGTLDEYFNVSFGKIIVTLKESQKSFWIPNTQFIKWGGNRFFGKKVRITYKVVKNPDTGEEEEIPTSLKEYK